MPTTYNMYSFGHTTRLYLNVYILKRGFPQLHEDAAMYYCYYYCIMNFNSVDSNLHRLYIVCVYCLYQRLNWYYLFIYNLSVLNRGICMESHLSMDLMIWIEMKDVLDIC